MQDVVHTSKSAGFTLVELCLTIVIASILSVSAMGAFQNSGASQVRGVAEKISNDVMYARRLAVQRSGVYNVSFNVANDQYSVNLVNAGTGAETVVTDPYRQGNFSVTIPATPGFQNVDLSSANIGGTAKVRFTSQGIPQDANGNAIAAAGVITVASGGVTKTIRIEPNTGEVSIQ